MDKEVLIQYCELMEEIKDIRRRIRELDKFLENPPIVADTVKGSRADLTIGRSRSMVFQIRCCIERSGRRNVTGNF